MVFVRSSAFRRARVSSVAAGSLADAQAGKVFEDEFASLHSHASVWTVRDQKRRITMRNSTREYGVRYGPPYRDELRL